MSGRIGVQPKQRWRRREFTGACDGHGRRAMQARWTSGVRRDEALGGSALLRNEDAAGGARWLGNGREGGFAVRNWGSGGYFVASGRGILAEGGEAGYPWSKFKKNLQAPARRTGERDAAGRHVFFVT